MKKFAGVLAIAALLGASLAFAQPKGTLRQAHEVAFGNASDVDPISKSRVYYVTEKVMNRLVRPGEHERLHRLIPNSRLVAFEDAGHAILHQCAGRLNHVLLDHFATVDRGHAAVIRA